MEDQQRKAKRSLPSSVSKRSITIAGHGSSVSLEEPFWRALKEIAVSKRIAIADLVSTVDLERQHGNLSSAIRLFVLDHYRQLARARRP